MKQVLATLAIGDHRKIHKVTKKRMEEYAKMIGAEYLVVTDTTQDPPHFAKFDLFKHFANEGYDRALYVDADVYIRNCAPNIFDHYEAAAFSEIPHPKAEWLRKPLDWIRENMVADWPEDRYFNTGVLVLDTEAIHSLAKIVTAAVPKVGAYFEQDQLNVLMRDVGFPRQTLEQKWNQFCGGPWITPAKAEAAYFLHATGQKNKHLLVERYSKRYP